MSPTAGRPKSIRVIMAGATGKTGSAVSRALLSTHDIKIVGAVAADNIGTDLGTFLGKEPLGIEISNDLEQVLNSVEADVLVDFTAPTVVIRHIELALKKNLSCVIGTTGIPLDEAGRLGKVAEQQGVALCIIANFSIGMMLLSRFAKEAAKYFPDIEIIEKHHATKVDAPSGTALRLGESIASITGRSPIPTHSVRLPGFVAHHEVIFSSAGENLTLSHDTITRDAFGPGVIQTVRATPRLRGLITDFEAVLNLPSSLDLDS